MTTAYIVLSHTHPALVARLVDRLLSGDPTAQVIVEHDAAGPPLALTPHERLTVRTGPRAGGWGGFGLVEAVLRSLREAVAPLDPDWVVLLSGQDYPLVPSAVLAERLARCPHDALLDLWHTVGPDLPSDDDGAPWRRARYHMRWYALPRAPLALPAGLTRVRLGLQRRLSLAQPFVFVWSLPRGAGTRLGIRRRRTPFGPGFPCRMGSQWFALSRRAVASVLRQTAARPDLERYFARTVIPDEAFFTTLVANDSELSVAGDNLTYARMEGEGQAHAAALELADLPALDASGKAFARRMDPERSAALMDTLDARLSA